MQMRHAWPSVALSILAVILSLAIGAGAQGEEILDGTGTSVLRYEGSYALLIGVSDYTEGWQDLTSVPGELEQVEAVLVEHGFEVTKVLDPTEQELRDAFESFIDEYGYVAGHRLLVYYAGHGYSRKLGKGVRGYLVPADAPGPAVDRQGFLGKSVPMVDVGTWARRIEARHALFVFDSCFSGTVFDTRGELPEPMAITAKMARPVRLFLTAGSADEEVSGTSVFTPAFVRALQGAADRNRDGYVTGIELGGYLDEQAGAPGQTPQFGRLQDYREGDVVFRLKRPAPPPPADLGLETLRRRAEEESGWSAYQRDLEKNFAAVEEIDRSDARPATRTEAWRRFLAGFAADNPYSEEDNRLRGIAEKQLTSRSSEPQPGEVLIDPAIGMRFRYIPAGTFMMGSPPTEDGRYDRETRHEVTLTRGFFIGETEVTQEQWRKVMGNNPSYFSSCGDDCPVEQVNWYEAIAFANALSERAGLTACYRVSGGNGKKPGEDLEYESVERLEGCTGYRLPTEAEWERAARGGRKTAIYTGGLTIRGLRHGPELEPIAWYGGNSHATYAGAYDCSDWSEKQEADLKTCGPQPVGRKEPNPWELHDVLGNVWEWTWDRYGSYGDNAQVDPVGPSEGTDRVRRGGSCYDIARNVRAASRSRSAPGYRWYYLGFRLARGQAAPSRSR